MNDWAGWILIDGWLYGSKRGEGWRGGKGRRIEG
jgi:hypothetical protein